MILIFCLLQAIPCQAARVCDDFGVCIEPQKPASRIIPLYGGLTDLLLVLGCKDQIVARTIADADKLGHLPAIGTHIRPNSELVAAQKPDLVLQMGGRQEAGMLTSQLRQLGLNVLTFEINNFEQLFSVLTRLGILTGREARARELAADWSRRLKALENAAPLKKPLVYYEIRQPNLLAAGQKNMVSAIIAAAGGQNVIKSPKKLLRCNEEELISLNPDFCVIQQGPMNPAPPPVSARPNLNNLKCAQPGHNLIVPEKEFARPGPASIVAAENLAQFLRQGEAQGKIQVKMQ